MPHLSHAKVHLPYTTRRGLITVIQKFLICLGRMFVRYLTKCVSIGTLRNSRTNWSFMGIFAQYLRFVGVPHSVPFRAWLPTGPQTDASQCENPQIYIQRLSG
jgi:hypothetical protein